MSKAVRIFWKSVLIGWGALIVFLILLNLGLFGKLPSLAELQNWTQMLRCRRRSRQKVAS